MISHRDHSFECVCKNGFFGEYCKKGLYAFLICCDSILTTFAFFFCFLIVQYHFLLFFLEGTVTNLAI